MKRRQFIFRSAKGAAFLLPVLSIRRAEAQNQPLQRLLVFVETGSYPFPEDFFPSSPGENFQLAPILRDFNDLRQDMVIVDGINIRATGPNPRNNNHLRSIGKLLTAKDIIAVEDPNNALPGGISIDEVIRQSWGARSIELQIHLRQYRHVRSQPFALGPRQFKYPEVSAAVAYDLLFRNFQIPEASGSTREPPTAALRQLKAKKSVLDGVLEDLSRFRKELDGMERLKLDMHEDAVRTAERSVTQEMSQLEDPVAAPEVAPQCTLPEREQSNLIPVRSRAHFDLIYAAFVCDRVRMANLIFGYSSPQWLYEWINLGLSSNIHDAVYHNRNTERSRHIQATRWNWNELARFLRQLKQTPEGSGNMLDNTLVFGTSHFGMHHRLERIPIVFFGSAQGRLRTGRFIRLSGSNHTNARALCSLGRLCGLDINGIGDEPQSGPIPGLV